MEGDDFFLGTDLIMRTASVQEEKPLSLYLSQRFRQHEIPISGDSRLFGILGPLLSAPTTFSLANLFHQRKEIESHGRYPTAEATERGPCVWQEFWRLVRGHEAYYSRALQEESSRECVRGEKDWSVKFSSSFWHREWKRFEICVTHFSYYYPKSRPPWTFCVLCSMCVCVGGVGRPSHPFSSSRRKKRKI